MQPRQLAALLGTEVDAGFAAALNRLDGSGALVVDTIHTRVGAMPESDDGEEIDWSEVPWLADVVLTPQPDRPTAIGGESPGSGSAHDDSTSDPVRRRVAALPVAAIRGVGPGWSDRLASWGITSVGDFAEADPSVLLRRAGGRRSMITVLLARARAAVVPWPAGLPGRGRSIADLATSTPDTSDVTGFMVREHCMSLLAVLDLDVAAATTVP